jgi:hypothetical protein
VPTHMHCADNVRASYGVDTRVFIALIAVSIPPFYIVFAIAIRRLAGLRRSGGSAPGAVARDRTFMTAVTVVAATWLLPYIYVALFGRLPWWAWVLFALLLADGIVGLFRAGRARVTIADRQTEPSS